MTSNARVDSASTESERTGFQDMSRGSVAMLDRPLTDMVLLTRLEAGLEERQAAPFDAGDVLPLLASVGRAIEHRLIAKRLCSLFNASIALDADEGIVTFRVNLPRSYD